MMATRLLCLLVAALLPLSSSSGLYQFTASLFGGDSTVSGELHAHDDGRLELVPLKQQLPPPSAQPPPQEAMPPPQAPVQLYGRGLGRWQRRSSGVYEASAQLYTYTTSDQPDEPSELLFLCTVDGRGMLRGCIFNSDGEKEQVGTVSAAPLGPTRSRLARSVRAVVPAAYAQLPPISRSFSSRSQLKGSGGSGLQAYRVGELDMVYYIPDFIRPEDEREIAAQLDASPEVMWSSMAGRRVQECGTCLASGGHGLLVESLPPWMRVVCERLVADGLFPRALMPNSVALNEYTRQEGIAPHSDGPIYAPRVAILSLFSPAVLHFYGRQPELPAQTTWSEETDTPAHAPVGEPVESLLLRPRSLLIFGHSAYREHCHEVRALPEGIETLGEAGSLVNGHLAGAAEGEIIERGDRRVSLTIRHVLDFLLAPEAFEQS